MTNPVSMLDHGFVRLVDSMGSDLSVVRAARVSYNAAARAGQDEGSDHKLINYLWKHKHTTPFEAVQFTFEVKAPIFVFRQWHRHRTWSYNELSARYRELPTEYYIPETAVLAYQSKNNKQGRDEPLNQASAAYVIDRMKYSCDESFASYRKFIEMGVAKEIARSVLPVNTYSHMFASVNLLNLLKFLTLRCDSHAQYEIRVYADAMREFARTVVPVCIQAWEQK